MSSTTTRHTLTSTLAGCVLGLASLTAGTAVLGAEKVAVTLIPVSIYGPWFIVQEKGMAKDIDLEVKVIEDITARNAGLSTGHLQCMMTTMDSTVVARAASIPVKHIAVPLMSYGLDEMVVDDDIKSVEDFAGRAYAADYGFLNHMWMLLTLKRAGMSFDSVEHKIMLPQDATAAFASGALDIDVNFIPFSTQSLERKDSYLFKSSRTDRTWERGLISDSIACNENWMSEKPDVAKEVLRSWFEAVNWWKENPEEGNEIIARGLDWPVGDVAITQQGTVMLTIDQNLGAIGASDGVPMCASIPQGAPLASEEPSNWGRLFGGADCEAGYLESTWEIFASVYQEAGVTDNAPSAADGIDYSIMLQLDAEGYRQTYSSNKWIGRAGS